MLASSSASSSIRSHESMVLRLPQTRCSSHGRMSICWPADDAELLASRYALHPTGELAILRRYLNLLPFFDEGRNTNLQTGLQPRHLSPAATREVTPCRRLRVR